MEALWAQRWATVVPHEPAPITPTRRFTAATLDSLQPSNGLPRRRPVASPSVSEEPATAVVVPIRSFDGALSRLEHVLGRSGCRDLMRRMAGRVVAAAGGLPVHVATDDAEVAAWAADLGADVVAVGRPGLNIAVAVAVDRLAAAGVERAVVAHADLALARTLRPAAGPGLVIVPDRRRDGSNVVCVPTGCGFRFAYGPGSFARHVAEAERLQLAVTVVQDDALASDIDHPEDLLALPARDRLALGVDSLAVSP
ncbi:MAG: hypothetical protein F4016_05265 [Acidimicrobiaceae bacterium]|nr:hypothetical protein [Acidimicrobiaceae bacterium]